MYEDKTYKSILADTKDDIGDEVLYIMPYLPWLMKLKSCTYNLTIS